MERIIHHKPKEKDPSKVKRISFDYPKDKYRILAVPIKEGIYPSVASILRDALDKVVKEHLKKSGKGLSV